MDRPHGIALVVLNEGQLCLTTDAIALATGIHPDDMPPAAYYSDDNLTHSQLQTLRQRSKEAEAHGATTLIEKTIYWARKQPNTTVHTDRLGQIWTTKDQE